MLVSFVVNSDGSISDIDIAKGVNKELDDAAVRVIKLMPKWEPGINNGKAVRTKYTIPIQFRIPEKQTDADSQVKKPVEKSENNKKYDTTEKYNGEP